ncbi:hypothetical protein HCU64_16035 [Methylobacterium sp. C25]|uniref:hypothetical protein n=1 Tax=Methylobacterium sp. C25 TaxID=2721622 RepID=UPI001F411A0A|nr:hypothetical protein [Methylobacterium sp. C25]MCE4225265.1 hypothetical protein [Methylobacterium sp. C25]
MQFATIDGNFNEHVLRLSKLRAQFGDLGCKRHDEGSRVIAHPRSRTCKGGVDSSHGWGWARFMLGSEKTFPTIAKKRGCPRGFKSILDSLDKLTLAVFRRVLMAQTILSGIACAATLYHFYLSDLDSVPD